MDRHCRNETTMRSHLREGSCFVVRGPKTSFQMERRAFTRAQTLCVRMTPVTKNKLAEECVPTVVTLSLPRWTADACAHRKC